MPINQTDYDGTAEAQETTNYVEEGPPEHYRDDLDELLENTSEEARHHPSYRGFWKVRV